MQWRSVHCFHVCESENEIERSGRRVAGSHISNVKIKIK